MWRLLAQHPKPKQVAAPRCPSPGRPATPPPPPLPQVHQGLQAARSSLLAVLPAVAAESYTRAYPIVAKLHMLTEMEEAFALMGRVGGAWGC
jgi:hypothetical protein